MIQSRRSFISSALAPACVPVLSGAAPASGNATPAVSYFDLAYRAGLALNPLTSLLDERQDYLPYFDAHYGNKPPFAVHIRWDYGDCVGRYIDALTLARIMSGGRERDDRDRALERWAERLIGDRGLSWWPEVPYRSRHKADPPAHMVDLTWTQRSAMTGFITLYQSTGDERYAKRVRGIVDGLASLAIWKDGMCWFPRDAAEIKSGDVLYPTGGWATNRTYSAGWFGAILGVLLWPLTRFSRLTGYAPALRLAQGLAEYILRETKLYRPDGRFYDLVQGHFYARTTAAAGLLSVGVLTGRREYVQMAELVYRHAKGWGTSFGWFPEDLSRTACETCCIKDMIELSIALAIHVDAKYWDDAEQYGRNHLLESQLTDISWVAGYSSSRQQLQVPSDALRVTSSKVMERARGGFAGWSGVNDWTSDRPQMMGCCHASGARALYDLWHYGITRNAEDVSIAMLFSRATADVVLKSYLPFEGRVDIIRKSQRNVRIRVPAFAGASPLRLETNGQVSTAHAVDGWIQLPPAKSTESVVLHFELPERKETVHLGYDSYEVTYRGNTVAEISPRGTVYPLYDRAWIKSAPPNLSVPAVPRGGEIDSI